ncbi:MAG: efflux RND transporter periplasmic adaptor subunit [Steroidobacteraceae bacterium]
MPIDQDALNSLRLERNTASAPRRSLRERRLWLIVALATSAALLLAVALWYPLTASRPVVQTFTVQAAGGGAQAAVLNASGYVVARRLATVSSKVTGKVVEVLIEEGMTVKRGQLLARLDDSTARAQYDLANSRRLSAQKSLDEVKVRLAEAQRQFVRQQSLKARGLVSEVALDNAQSEVAALEARLVALEGEVAVAASGLRLQQRDLEDLEVRAPFDGVVTSKDAQPGEMVSPVSAGGGFTRTGIATVVDMDSREIEVDVNEAFINRVRAGQRTEAVLDAYPDWTIPSHVINIVPTADRQKATVRVRIGFDELDPRILPDMGIKVRFLEEGTIGGGQPALTARVPAGAVARDGEQEVVWVVKGNVLERRAVRVGAERDGLRDALAGVAAGEVLVASPTAALRDGMKVRIGENAK